MLSIPPHQGEKLAALDYRNLREGLTHVLITKSVEREE